MKYIEVPEGYTIDEVKFKDCLIKQPISVPIKMGTRIINKATGREYMFAKVSVKRVILIDMLSGDSTGYAEFCHSMLQANSDMISAHDAEKVAGRSWLQYYTIVK